MAHIDTTTAIAQYADRPFTDSEVRFLKYIRQWGKKVVFLVNKVDILSDSTEVSAIGSGVKVVQESSTLPCYSQWLRAGHD